MKPELEKETQVARIISRREVLGLIGATAALSLVGDAGGQSASKRLTIPPCVVRPQQTEGPFFVDEELKRSDIRTDPSDGSVSQGIQLRLALNLHQIQGNSCTPLPGAIVDIWHCDAMGVYSDVMDEEGLSKDTRGKKFLRGYQVTNENGGVEFITIYPGWYPYRTVHIHFKIRTDPASRRSHEFTSQLYFEESTTDQIYSLPPYSSRKRRITTNARDGIFDRGGKQLMLHPTKEAEGYAGTFDIGLHFA